MLTEFEDPEEMIYNVCSHIEGVSHRVHIVDSGDLSGFECSNCDLGWVSKGYLIEELAKGSRAWDQVRDLLFKGLIQPPVLGGSFKGSVEGYEPTKMVRLSRFARILS
jgi:hypothetical protein